MWSMPVVGDQLFGFDSLVARSYAVNGNHRGLLHESLMIWAIIQWIVSFNPLTSLRVKQAIKWANTVQDSVMATSDFFLRAAQQLAIRIIDIRV